MKLARVLRAGLLTLAFCAGGSALAQQIAVPALTARVTDQTATLTAEQKASLEQTLQAFEASKGSQISVLIVPTTGAEPIEQYALRVAEAWKLGRKKVDDGALLIVAKDDRAMRIEVGYGLEGVLNDATSKRIISEVITPGFKAGDYYRGISDGVASMIKVVSGEALPAPAPAKATRGDGGADFGSLLPLIFMGTVVIGGIMRKMFGRMFGSLLAGGITGVLAWMFVGALSIAMIAGVVAAALTLFGGGMGGMLGGRRGGFGGGFGGFGGGGGGGFGGGGGGFSGGGGSFGGGGASGRW